MAKTSNPKSFFKLPSFKPSAQCFAVLDQDLFGKENNLSFFEPILKTSNGGSSGGITKLGQEGVFWLSSSISNSKTLPNKSKAKQQKSDC